MAVMVNFLAAW